MGIIPAISNALNRLSDFWYVASALIVWAVVLFCGAVAYIMLGG